MTHASSSVARGSRPATAEAARPHQPNNANDLKKGVPWSEEEHRCFLKGLQNLGKGNWRGISRMFVPSRSPTQVASHAQKYFLRLNGCTKRRSRFSGLEQTVKQAVCVSKPGRAASPPSPSAGSPGSSVAASPVVESAQLEACNAGGGKHASGAASASAAPLPPFPMFPMMLAMPPGGAPFPMFFPPGMVAAFAKAGFTLPSPPGATSDPSRGSGGGRGDSANSHATAAQQPNNTGIAGSNNAVGSVSGGGHTEVQAPCKPAARRAASGLDLLAAAAEASSSEDSTNMPAAHALTASAHSAFHVPVPCT